MPELFAVEGVWHRGAVTEPTEIAAHRRYTWQSYWQGRPQELRAATVKAKEVKARAKLEKFVPPTPAEVDNALCTFREDTGLGLDGVGPRFVKMLPKKGREELTLLLGEAAAHLAWP